MPIPFLFQQQTGLAKVLNGSQFYAPRTSSITQTRGSGTPTETRATTATVMGYAPNAVLADGQTLLTVASGELRFQGGRRISEGVWSDVDANGVPIPATTLDGSVVEAAATNLCLQSQTFGTAPWGVSNAVVNSDAATSPSGTTTADRLIDSNLGGSGVVQVFTVQTVSAGTNVFSCYMKADQLSWGGITTGAFDATAGGETTFNLANGVVGTKHANHSSAGIDAVGNGWHHCWVVFTTTVDLTGEISIRPEPSTTPGVVPLNGTSSIYIWGAQVELGSYATAYQATTTAAVTRNKDVLDDLVAGNLTAAAGSVAFQFTPLHAPSGTIALGGSYVDANNYTQILHDATNLILRKRIGGVDKDATIALAFASGTTYKVAVRWGAGGIQVAVNGVLGTPDADATAAQLGTRWQWGADGNGGQQAGACFKEKYLYTRALSDSELQAVTA